MAELSRLNTGSRESTSPGGGGVAMGDTPLDGLDGGVDCWGNTNPCWNVGLFCSGKKLVIELVGLSDNEPVGEARSEPVDIDMAGDRGM
jgi:hypothetical protein